MSISIIIPNYNGRHYLESILVKLMESNHELIVIDNASSDGSREYLDDFKDRLVVLQNDENVGFSIAVNQGIKVANYDYVLLLNNDTDFDTHAFNKMIECMDSDVNIFSVASKMVQYYDMHLIDTAGDEYNMFGWAHKRGYNKSSDTRNIQKRVFSSCAGAALYRRSLFEEVGYFDETFFAYMEDVDIGFRANILGYKNIYCPEAVIYHIGSGTSGSGRNAFKAKLSGRNNIYVAYKNMPLFQLLLNAPTLFIGFTLKWYFFKRHGLENAYKSGVLEGLQTYKKVEKVQFKWSNISHYFWIQFRMFLNVFAFVFNRVR